MIPYYEVPGIRLYHGNAREIFPMICAEARVMLTDPPYGVSYKSGWSDRQTIRGDSDISTRNEILGVWRERPAIVFGKWSIRRPQNTKLVLIWDKGEWPGMGDLAFPWGISHEEIYVLGEGFKGKRMGTVLRLNRIAGNGDHPNEKPIALLGKLLERCPDGLVIDPFCGVGSTLCAAQLEQRAAIGIEIEEKYCEIAAKRLSQDVFNFSIL